MTDAPGKDKKYLSLANEIDDLRYGLGAKDKSIAGLKLVGKSLFNVTKLIFSEILPAFVAAQQKEINKQTKK
jgi:hypothetical protein